jgi:hypothetical protein
MIFGFIKALNLYQALRPELNGYLSQWVYPALLHLDNNQEMIVEPGM